MEEMGLKQAMAIKGTARAAAMFHNVLVKNEQARSETAEILKLIAMAANNECLRFVANNHANKNGTETDEAKIHESAGIELIRKSLLNDLHEDSLEANVAAFKHQQDNQTIRDRRLSTSTDTEIANKYELKNKDYFLTSTLKLLAERKHNGEDMTVERLSKELDEKIRIKKENMLEKLLNERASANNSTSTTPMVSPAKISRSLTFKDTVDKLISNKVVEVKSLVKVGEDERDWVSGVVKNCSVNCGLKGADMSVVVEGEWGGGDWESSLKFVQKVPKLIEGDHELAKRYATSLVNCLELVCEGEGGSWKLVRGGEGLII